ncbi:MAG: hypothetical protein Q8N05_04975 [Bacteroidota bacterium]|nr:hypothetical protein [Bacteroidota bacterium]
MKKIQNRRNFLKKISVVAGISQLPLISWSVGFKTLFNIGVNPEGEFSLLKLEKLLSGYKFPFTEQFSTVSFKSEYKLYNLYGNNAVFAGEFLLESRMKGKNRWFDFLNWRLADDGIKNKDQKFKYIVSGNVKCKTDSTFSPEKWNVSSRISHSEEGVAFGGTGIINEGKATRGEISLKTAGKSIKKTFGLVPLSWKWGLLAVVQNMAESSLHELRFSMLDEFDVIHKNQTLKNRKKVSLDCGDGHLIDFRVFKLTGEGIIPTVYWVDNMNRTVFVISGMEAFVLDK